MNWDTGGSKEKGARDKGLCNAVNHTTGPDSLQTQLWTPQPCLSLKQISLISVAFLYPVQWLLNFDYDPSHVNTLYTVP